MVERVRQGQRPQEVAAALGVSVRTVRKWVGRYEREGRAGVLDRSSRPTRLARITPAKTERRVLQLRRQRMTGIAIARRLGLPRSTVGAILRRHGLGRLKDLDPPKPVRRYERKRPGELLHLDVKKLGRFDRVGHRIHGRRTGIPTSRQMGWDFVHVCIDDHSRVAYVEVHRDERKETAAGFLRRAVAWYARRGVDVERVMTDNGSCYKSRLFAATVVDLGARHIRTRPYSPQTNGKAERFIQTLQREWAYGVVYSTSDDRNAALPAWLERYNRVRPHGALGALPPWTRLPSAPAGSRKGAKAQRDEDD